MKPPTLKCKSHAETMRVANWLSESGMACTIRFNEQEIEIGTTGEPPNTVTLDTYKAAPDLLAALEAVMKCNKELGGISRPVANEARAAISKAKGQP